MKFVKENESIQCNEAYLCARSFLPQDIVNFEGYGELYQYSLRNSAESEILNELNPKKPVKEINPHSNLNKGQKLTAYSIDVFLDSLKLIKPTLISNRTSTHGGREAKTKCFTYAIIMIPFSIFLNMKKEIDSPKIKEKIKKK